MVKTNFLKILAMYMMFTQCSPPVKVVRDVKGTAKNNLVNILKNFPQYFDSILKKKDELNVQVIYTQIERKKNAMAGFTDFYFNVNDDNYFYPASTVKFPVAVLALQKLNELNLPGLDKHTIMLTGTDSQQQTEALHDSTAADGKPTIAQYIKKILLVSDNDAFNRLYEFLGQEYINNSLHKMGYKDVQIIHRLSVSLNEEENRHTNPVTFYDSAGNVIYKKPAEKSKLVYAHRETKLGKGYMSGNTLINEPFDFSRKNRFGITALHDVVRSVMFPEMVDAEKKFNLSSGDYEFLHKYMSMLPRESKYPFYDAAEYSDSYVKHFIYGYGTENMDAGIRIFNKTGTAYGFLIDAAYIVDFNHNIEFMITAVISCNSDGIYNDDQYDYKDIGYPFFKHLGQVIYAHELKRKRRYEPDFSSIKFDY